MLCEKCGQNSATVRVVHVENGKKTELNLCQSCAQGYSGFAAGFDLQNILATMFDQPHVWGTVSQTEQKTCPTCGSSLADIQKRGKLGCSDCYTTFQPEVQSLLRRIHGFTKHTGKIPATGHAKVRIERQIEEARRRLNECIQTENFEEAAHLRDEIRRLEKSAAGEDES